MIRVIAEMSPQLRRSASVFSWGLTPVFEVLDRGDAIERMFSNDAGASFREAYTGFYRLPEPDRRRLFNHCAELDCIHEDLDFALNALMGSGEMHSDDAYTLRLALLYHSDNVDHRVYAYFEKVFLLVNHFLRRGVHDDLNGEFRSQVAKALELNHAELAVLLKARSEHPEIREPIDRRRLFVHKLARRDRPVLTSRQRIVERIIDQGEVDELCHLGELDTWRVVKTDELEVVCRRPAQFRYDVVGALVSAVA